MRNRWPKERPIKNIPSLEAYGPDGPGGRREVVHLLRTRGESQCGAPGKADPDITRVTCDECFQQHEDLCEEVQ
jgi:hypothetical protein